jgi:hypothetical protein
MKQSNKRTPIVFYVALVLLCCLLFSTHLTSGLYARYTTTATASDSARVAKFSVTNRSAGSVPVSVRLSFFDPAAISDTVSVEVESASEVTLRYDVIVTMPTLPESGTYEDWFILLLDGNAPTSVSGNTFTFSAVDTISAGDTSVNEHELIFAIATSYLGNPNVVKNVDTGTVQITVHAEQVD